MTERPGLDTMPASSCPIPKLPLVRALSISTCSWFIIATTGLICCLLYIGAGPVAAAEPPGFEVATAGTLKAGEPLPKPKYDVILTIRGATSKFARAGVLKFDRATLEAMGMIRYTSKNRWYDKPVTYEGVLGSQLMRIIGVPSKARYLLVRALNDYAVRIPVSDFSRWPVMFALKLDGKYMTIREKGPIWVVYPNHLYPELGRQPHLAKWIWQLKSIEFE